MQEISTKPYLLRALYEWCTDNGFTPHIAVRVDNGTRVPRQFVRNDEIVLNISFEATSQLQMGNEWIEFSARFSGKSMARLASEIILQPSGVAQPAERSTAVNSRCGLFIGIYHLISLHYFQRYTRNYTQLSSGHSEP